MTSGGISTAPSLQKVRELSSSYNIIPVSHTFLNDTETPVSAFLKLRQPAGSFLLESAEQGQRFGRYSFLGIAPRESIRLKGDVITVRRGGVDHHHDLAGVGGDPFKFLADHVAACRVPALPDLPPFVGGAVGYFGYDIVRHIEHLPAAPPDDLDIPELAFLVTDLLVIFDHLRHSITLLTNVFVDDEPDIGAGYETAMARLANVKAVLSGPLPPATRVTRGAQSVDHERPEHLLSTFDRPGFMSSVQKIKDYITAGDAFQVVLSQRFQAPVDISSFSIYRGLRAVNPSPYMYFFSFRDFDIVGSSPEPLVMVSGHQVETRPIAGTRPRGDTSERDLALAEELLADEKERAEHLMLVDLGRNDLGRVCRPGTVRVADFMSIERYSHVMHMVSRVTGVLQDGMTAAGALAAAFPAGTVSGAPKIRAMEIIDELEPVKRGPYAGTIGYLSYSGELDTCIYIRTILVKDGVAYVQAGAGIVADSDPAREYDETANKARALFRAIELAGEQEGWE